MGFIIFSIPVMIYEERAALKKFYNILFMILGAALVVFITYANPSGGMEITAGSVNFVQLIYIAFVGMIAISAMVLPGISGSTILLIFGVYLPVMNSIKDVLHFNFCGLPIVIAAGIGILAGVVIIIKLVKASIEHFRPQTVYTIIGLMIGSLVAIVKGPESLEVPKESLSFSNFSVLFFLIGGAVIIGLQFLKFFMSDKKDAQVNK